MKMSTVFFALSVATAGQAGAADLYEQVAQKLAENTLLRADFTQTRHLAALKKPLQISGHMMFSRDAGVIWQIDRPYRMGYVMTGKGVTELLPDGGQKTRSTGNIPGIGSVEGIFRGILSADRKALDQHFNSQLKGSAAKWNLSLQPRTPALQKALKSVELSGGAYVDEVRILEVSGDDTQIRFSKVEPVKKLTADESRLLGLN